MNYFSSLYKKMCENAVEIQSLWKERIQNWDEYCSKEDLEDGFGQEVHLGGMTEDEIEELIGNNVWLPLEYQIREKLFRTHGLASIRDLVEKEYSKYLSDICNNSEELNLLRKHFEGAEIVNAISLMFVMKKYNKKQWDFIKQNWIEK